MKTVTLNISNRFKILQILDGFKGSMDKLAKILDDAKLLSISEAEWEQAARTKTPFMQDGKPSESWAWDNEKGPKIEVELNDTTVEFVRNFIKEKDTAGELTLADKDLIDVDKLLS